MRALPFQAPAPHVYIRMRQANIEKRLSKSWPKKKFALSGVVCLAIRISSGCSFTECAEMKLRIRTSSRCNSN